MQPQQAPIMQPSSPQPAVPQQPIAQSAPYKQSHVVYLAGATVMTNRHEAILEWGADNRIRFYAIDTGQPALLFDCLPQEIKTFSSGMGMANVKLLNGTLFKIEFGTATRNQALGGAVAAQFGLVGMGVSTLLDKNASSAESSSDITWWSENLARFGVGGINASVGMLYKIDKVGWIVMGVVIGLVVLVIIIVAIIAAVSGG